MQKNNLKNTKDCNANVDEKGNFYSQRESNANKKILIWGTGNTAKNVLSKGVVGDIIGFIVTQPTRRVFQNMPIYAPDEIGVDYDFIYVASTFVNEIYEAILLHNLPMEKVCFMRLPDALKVEALNNYTKAEKFLSPANLAYISKEKRETSITDNGVYPAFCLAAATNNDIFETFRKDPVYCEVLEHVTPEFGQKYLEVIEKSSQVTFTDDDWDNFCKNDLYGGSDLSSYKINGKTRMMAPSTLRYIKVLQDISNLFDVKKLKSVAEIGVGYAGQCRLMLERFKTLQSYYLIDLPEVLSLAKKYLSYYNVVERTQFIDGISDFCAGRTYDLVLSNYAFSELKRDIQDLYLDKVISKASAGYITWNALSYDFLDGYSVDELLKKIPGSKIMEENPRYDVVLSQRNCIIIWGQK